MIVKQLWFLNCGDYFYRLLILKSRKICYNYIVQSVESLTEVMIIYGYGAKK